MQSSLRTVRRSGVLLVLGAVLALAAGCHSNTSNTSGYGVTWVTLGTVPAPIFTSYVVTLDSVALTDSLGNTVTAVAVPEPVDLVKLRDVRQLWGSATIPNSVQAGSPTSPTTYVSATLTLDYTNAQIFVLVNGLAQRASVIGVGGTAITTQTVQIRLDPAQQLNIVPSYSTDNAQILALNFDLLASNRVNLATSPATVTVLPFATAALAPPDQGQLTLIRGSLANSSVPLGTYSVYNRPFYEQAASSGELSVFNYGSTIYTLDGVAYSGSAGLNALAVLPAGITMTATYTTFEPTSTATGFAGKFNAVYMIGGNSLQSNLTENISGDVVAISTDATTGIRTLVVRGATIYGPLVALSEGYFGYQQADALLLIGPSTLVTVDAQASSAGLSYNSIAVGDHVEAVGAWSCTGTCGNSGLGTWTIDATSAATGKVRIVPTTVYGTLQSAAGDSLTIALQTINYWPASDFDFTGNGSSAGNDPTAGAFVVNTGSTSLAGTATGTPLWITGAMANFGTAPPDFNVLGVPGQPGISSVGSGQLPGMPATLKVEWTSAGTVAPFAAGTLTSSGFQVDLSNPQLATAVLQFGAQSVALSTLPQSPQIVTTQTPISVTAEPIFAPHYAYSTISTVATVDVNNVNVFTTFSAFVPHFVQVLSAANPALEMTASGTYDSTTNQFYANTVSIVL